MASSPLLSGGIADHERVVAGAANQEEAQAVAGGPVVDGELAARVAVVQLEVGDALHRQRQPGVGRDHRVIDIEVGVLADVDLVVAAAAVDGDREGWPRLVNQLVTVKYWSQGPAGDRDVLLVDQTEPAAAQGGVGNRGVGAEGKIAVAGDLDRVGARSAVEGQAGGRQRIAVVEIEDQLVGAIGVGGGDAGLVDEVDRKKEVRVAVGKLRAFNAV